MTTINPFLMPQRCAIVALIVLSGCTGSPSPDQGNRATAPAASSASQPAGGSAAVNGYPDWAEAVVPPYASNVTSAGATTTDQDYQTYQINTADPYETVLAWYKTRVKTDWPTHRHNQTVGKVGKVHITLQTVDAGPSDRTRTTIGLIMRR